MGTRTGTLEWDIYDRLRKSLRVADVAVQDMAEYLGVSRNTVGRYLNGHATPDLRTLRLWAIHCGVPLDWLMNGQERERGGYRDLGDAGAPAAFTDADIPSGIPDDARQPTTGELVHSLRTRLTRPARPSRLRAA